MPKPPVAPRDDAPKAEHKRHAKEVLEHTYYQRPPAHLPKNDDVTTFKNNDKKP